MAQGPTSAKKDDIVVFWIVRASRCAECGDELGKGRFLRLEGDRPLCLSCADLAHLVFLPSGDAALTRRATKHSTLRAVVVRFSRARKRYERQGILVQEQALQTAEAECLADAEARARARERAAERRAELDERYVATFAERIGTLYPGCPESECTTIAEHACLKYSGRVGRSADAKRLETRAVELAVGAHVRHVHTLYDELLAQGRDRHEARAEVAGAVEGVLRSWKETTPVGAPSRQS